MDGKRSYSNILGPFCFFQLVFAMQRVKACCFFFFFFFFGTLKGINVLWRGDGLVFLKCLVCYYCSKDEISSALSQGSHSSLGGQRLVMSPLSELKAHSSEKVMG